MGMGGGQEQKAEELEHFPFCQGFGEDLLWGEKDGQGASSSARSCWLPILSLLRGDVAVSLSSSVELACGPGDWRSEKEREASQGPTGWAKVLLPSSLPPGVGDWTRPFLSLDFPVCDHTCQEKRPVLVQWETILGRGNHRRSLLDTTWSSPVGGWSVKARSELEI